MSYDEDDLLPISALSHLSYCERRYALVHLEQVWEENRFTAEGRILHERVDGGEYETRKGVRTARSLPLRSFTLGVTGRADVVEFYPIGPPEPEVPMAALALAPRLPAGKWRAYPVEFKRGKPKRDRCDEVQLCAQALCLEEMLGVSVPSGALFYGRTRRRLEVEMTNELRGHTAALATRLHQLWTAHLTPPPIHDPRCRNCSLVDRCMPDALGRHRRVNDYLARALGQDATPHQEDAPP